MLDLGAAVGLTAGTYWVSVQANSTNIQWLWANRSVIRGSSAAWQGSPPATAGCVAGLSGWFTRAQDCTMTGGGDQVFRLEGSASTGGTAVPSTPIVASTPAAPAAPKKKCKKGQKLKKGKCVKKKRKK